VTPMPRLGEHPWLDAYAAATVTPGGGSASAVAAALGCALVAMAARIGGRKAAPEHGERLRWLAGEAERLRGALVEQERADAGVYERMVATVRAAGRPPATPAPSGPPSRRGPTPPTSRWSPPSWRPRGSRSPPSWRRWG